MRNREGKTLRELVSQHDIYPVVVDIGARLKGSNSYDLITRLRFHGILSEKNNAHLRELRKVLPGCEFHGMATVENVNDIVPRDVGVLCIDVDGNDYHLWKAIKKTPQIVVIEIGQPPRIRQLKHPIPWIPPYDPKSRKRFDGACDVAMTALATERGYKLHKRFNVNMIFVHESLYASA